MLLNFLHVSTSDSTYVLMLSFQPIRRLARLEFAPDTQTAGQVERQGCVQLCHHPLPPKIYTN